MTLVDKNERVTYCMKPASCNKKSSHKVIILLGYSVGGSLIYSNPAIIVSKTKWKWNLYYHREGLSPKLDFWV